MQMVKRSLLGLLLSFFVISCVPQTAQANLHVGNVQVSYKQLALIILATPIILVYIQDSLPKEITESAIFKAVIGKLEKDEKIIMEGFDKETEIYKVRLSEKEPATGLVGIFHAKFVKPIKKITDDCKLIRDVALIIAALVAVDQVIDTAAKTTVKAK